mmetsp:Transcript_139148/g.444046  ORF Transcript_139148/g.444046 Transcript_139148/m.444046 type:complete len:222 (+) Transcript_139148:202-867(+)
MLKQPVQTCRCNIHPASVVAMSGCHTCDGKRQNFFPDLHICLLCHSSSRSELPRVIRKEDGPRRARLLLPLLHAHAQTTDERPNEGRQHCAARVRCTFLVRAHSVSAPEQVCSLHEYEMLLVEIGKPEVLSARENAPTRLLWKRLTMLPKLWALDQQTGWHDGSCTWEGRQVLRSAHVMGAIGCTHEFNCAKLGQISLHGICQRARVEEGKPLTVSDDHHA